VKAGRANGWQWAVVSALLSANAVLVKGQYVRWHWERIDLHLRGMESTWLSVGLVDWVNLVAMCPAGAALVCGIIAVVGRPRWPGAIALVLACFACAYALVVM